MMWLIFHAHRPGGVFTEDSSKLPDTRLQSFALWLISKHTVRSGHCPLGTALYSLQHASPPFLSDFHGPSEATLGK